MAQNPENKKSSRTPVKGGKGKSYDVKTRNTKEGTAKKSAAQKKADELRQKKRNSVSAQITPFVVGFIALLLAMFIYLEAFTGAAGGAIGAFFKGILAGGSLLIPPSLILLAIRWRCDAEEGLNGLRVALSTIFLILLSSLLHIWAKGEITFSIPTLWRDGLTLKGGGVIGGLFGSLLWNCFRIAAPIMLVGGLVLVTPMLFGITPKDMVDYIVDKFRLARERHDEAEAEREILRRDRREKEKLERESGVVGYGTYSDDGSESGPEGQQLTIEDELKNAPKRRRHSAKDYETGDPIDEDDDIETEEDDYGNLPPKIDPAIFDAAIKERDSESARLTEKITPENDTDPDDNIVLKEIFASDSEAKLIDKLCDVGEGGEEAEAELEIKREPAGTVTEIEPEDEPDPTAYVYPPLELLTYDDSAKDPEISEELQENAVKLVETLRSFNVKTKISDVLRGPTITRYEVMPESGTKVRTIANLTDDIALAFAAKGVRIEAPVPGKSVVGIEVPNKVASTVYLRTLIDSAAFTEAKSRLHAALGMDVAGEPVYLDIAKMPHLLVAGATGMGKSVCINCLLVSLLYRSTPEEVKLILIDPKKVEFNLYEGLPHLLVPVVSDPKKAAGSLSWAVSEMERRFNMLENARVRDIAKYNAVARMNEGWEILPQIVIIIDELADLMMTASDDVEKSIARLAQKARAAGMHLIIGTQRPSVDVITGLIKNNIPSRISCAVTSQVDSRTILDRAGAEKLIGRGDMLYKPVGIDPIRVQGAFVSESEVEAIVEYIKMKNNEKSEGYSEEVIEQIEREAEKCGNTGKKKAAPAGDDDGVEEDPAFMDALELAVESRKISTSLIQRKMSLGYGRAAKIVDRMEELGYVSAPDGQKPRDVLISREEFLEMSMKDEE